MGTQVPIPLGDYTLRDPRASGKQLVGCFPVPLDTDAVNSSTSQTSAPDGKQPSTLQRMHGTVPFASLISPQPYDTNVRGFDNMGGIQYAVIGMTLYTVSPAGVLNAISGSQNNIPHNWDIDLGQSANNYRGQGQSDFVRMTNNTQCMVILIPGTNQMWTYSVGGGFQQMASSFFLALGATDCWFVDTYIVFLAAASVVGENPATALAEGASYTFFNDDGSVISGSGPITFTSAATFTREFGTDLFVGGIIDHREILLMGTKTSEGYVNVGASVGTPFQAAPDSFMHGGCHYLCAYTIAMQDEAPIWVANDLTVRRRNGQTPVKISTSGIDQFLKDANLLGCYALTPTVDGQPLWVLTVPNAYGLGNGRSIAYSCLTGKWFDLESMINNIGCWRPLCHTQWRGLQLLGDSQSAALGVLSPTSFTEFYSSPGEPQDETTSNSFQVCAFTTQAIYSGNNRIIHRRLEVVMTPGGTPVANLRQTPYDPNGGGTGTVTTAYAPTCELFVSDNGYVFESYTDPVSLGALGDYDKRAFWFNLGQARMRFYQFRVTEPTKLFTVDIQAELSGGKW